MNVTVIAKDGTYERKYTKVTGVVAMSEKFSESNISPDHRKLLFNPTTVDVIVLEPDDAV